MLVTEHVTLESVTAKLAQRRATMAGIEREIETATQEGAGIKTMRERFLVPASTGDNTATAHVEELEQKQLVVGRKIEGLRIRLQTAEREVQEAQAEWIALNAEARAADHARRFAEMRARLKKLAWNYQAQIRAMYRTSFELAEVHRTDVVLGNWTDHEKAILSTELREAAALPSFWNEKWKKAILPFLPPATIGPTAAPDELRHLEVLK